MNPVALERLRKQAETWVAINPPESGLELSCPHVQDDKVRVWVTAQVIPDYPHAKAVRTGITLNLGESIKMLQWRVESALRSIRCLAAEHSVPLVWGETT